jgi:hypothetical protein
VFKQLLNLKELPPAEHINFFRDSNQPALIESKNDAIEPNKLKRNRSRSVKIKDKDEVIRRTIQDLQNQLIQSQLLVTCLVHNLQLIRRKALGVPVVDLVGSDQLLRHLRQTHNESRSNRAIFSVSCDQKRESLRNLKQQLRDTRLRCWRAIRFNLDRPQFDPLPLVTKSEVDGANGSSSKSNNPLNDLVVAMDKRSERLSRLEVDCRSFLTNLEQKYGESRNENPLSEVDSEHETAGSDSLELLASVEWANLDASLEEFELDEDAELLDEVSDEEDDDDDDDDHEVEVTDDAVETNAIEATIVIGTNGEVSEIVPSIDTTHRDHELIADLISTVADLPVQALRASNGPNEANRSDSRESIEREEGADNLINFDEIIEASESHRLSLPIGSMQRRASDEIGTPLTSNSDQNLAETGEPVQLCRLRRRAVEVLASRWRTERAYFDQRENELRDQLSNLRQQLREANERANQSRRNVRTFWISTCSCCLLAAGSLVGWFGPWK